MYVFTTIMYDEISQIGGWRRQRGGGASFEQIKGLNSERYQQTYYILNWLYLDPTWS